jgi:hypothetical protein
MRVLRRSGAIVGLCLALVVTSCGDTSADEDAVALYSAVIRRVAAGDSAELPKMVFVETLPGTEIALAEQTSIVNEFDEATDVRFIDDEDEAIDDAEPGAPVRHSGVLVRVGAAERSDHSTLVKAVRYVDRGNEQTFCLQLSQTGDDWEAVAADVC